MVSTVNEYWVSQAAPNDAVWAHEVRLCDQGDMQCLMVYDLI